MQIWEGHAHLVKTNQINCSFPGLNPLSSKALTAVIVFLQCGAESGQRRMDWTLRRRSTQCSPHLQTARVSWIKEEITSQRHITANKRLEGLKAEDWGDWGTFLALKFSPGTMHIPCSALKELGVHAANLLGCKISLTGRVKANRTPKFHATGTVSVSTVLRKSKILQSSRLQCHRTTAWLRLEGSSGGHLVQPRAGCPGPRPASWLLKISKLMSADKIYLGDTHFLPSYASLPGKTNVIKQVAPKINQQIQ